MTKKNTTAVSELNTKTATKPKPVVPVVKKTVEKKAVVEKIVAEKVPVKKVVKKKVSTFVKNSSNRKLIDDMYAVAYTTAQQKEASDDISI